MPLLLLPLLLLFCISLNAAPSIETTKQFFKDQDQEKGFKTYIEFIDSTKGSNPAGISQSEQQLYDQALLIYLDHSQANPQENSIAILRTFGPELSAHPDYLQLAYIVAAAEANLGDFQTFFDHFYLAYKNNPDHFIAYKTKAILHIKLLERARTPPERKEQLKKILDNIRIAIERYPHDTSLYKIQVSFADGDQKSRIISDSLNKIIQDNIIVPRVDIAFYVQKAADDKQYELAQRFIDKARSWYSVSRFFNFGTKLPGWTKNQIRSVWSYG